MIMPRTLALLALPLLLSPLTAQAIIVPAANAASRGTSGLNTLVRNSGNPRTYMLGINASQLTGIPNGAVITGVSFRFSVSTSNSPSWPAADINWTDYQIWAGPAIPTAMFTGDFMKNFSAAPVQVRSGPMRLPAGSFKNTSPTAPLPNPWAEFYFDFQTAYTYTGGDLGLLFSHPGSTDTAAAQFIDYVANNAAAHGVSYAQSIFPPGTAGVVSSFCIPRIHFGYGKGCPGTGNKTPMLVQTENASGGLGGKILCTTANGPAGAICVFILGVSRISAQLPNGCFLLTPPALTLPVVLDNFGAAVLPLTVPPAVKVTVNLQSAILDKGAKGGLTTTNGVEPAGS
jgi:hypothetical protein